MHPLPLEKAFIKAAEDKSCFPNMALNYIEQYFGLVNHLRTNIYNHIDTGLAANSSMPGFFTAHNAEHFDEVVRYAGQLMNVLTGDEKTHLTPYELYMLLVAIRIHDIGNIYGREEHEKKCFAMLKSFGAVAGSDDAEKKLIGRIAEAHGGKTSTNCKDTIGTLEERLELGSGIVRPRLIASIVRFADEICESRRRSAEYLINNGGALPKQSEVFHYYAASIAANTVSMSDKRLTIRYEVKQEFIQKPWGCAENKEIFLIDEILNRLEKIDRERRYCNRYSRELYTLDSVRASIHILDCEHDILLEIPVPELCDAGYPEDSPLRLTERLKEFCGTQLINRISNL